MTSGRRRTLATLCLAAAVMVGRNETAESCGPFFEEAIFTHRLHPDLPLRPFSRGELGIVQPTYARSYLVVAYRYFAGRPLSTAEQDAIGALWNERLIGWEQRSWMDDPGKAISYVDPADRGPHVWLSQRNALPTLAPLKEIETFRAVATSTYFDYASCLPDAFRRAAQTLARVTKATGADQQATLEWARAQDVVFEGCSQAGGVPPPLPETATRAARADRDYQIAAALFYNRRFDEAAARFRTIGQDAQSPWHSIAPYLAARALIRKGTLLPEEGRIDRPSLEQAAGELTAIMGDATRSDMHAASRALLGFVRFRLDPESRLRELGAAISTAASAQTFRQDVDDYTRLIDKVFGERPMDPAQVVDMPGPPADPMADWIVTFQWPGQAALDHAIARWEIAHETPWLVAAISKISARDPRSTSLRAAALAVPAGTPGAATLIYHALRLAAESGEHDVARRDLDALLSARQVSLPRSAANQFRELRLTLATNQQDWLAFSTRLPTLASSDADGLELPDADSQTLQKIRETRLFDTDATNALNRGFPLARLVELAQGPSLPARLRHDIAVAAWTRAVLIGNDAIATRIATTLRTLTPEMNASLDQYTRLGDETSRQLAAVTLLLRFPGTGPLVDAGLARVEALNRIDSFRDNWWCALDSKRTSASPSYLTDDDRETAEAEYLRLTALPTAPDFLAAEAVRLARLRPDDPRAPEILHLAVRATRYGCTSAKTGPRSQAAFDLLHRRYPQSEWTKKTPFWYDGR